MIVANKVALYERLAEPGQNQSERGSAVAVQQKERK
jgi:hypothetical protein